jgi:hypothetical protein
MSPAIHHGASASGFGRRVVASLWAAVVGPYLLLAICVPVARALGAFERLPVPTLAALGVIAGPLAVASFPRLSAALPEALDGWFGPEHRVRTALWTLGALFAVLSFARIAVFLADPTRVDCSLMPGDAFLVRHSCLTAYMHGAILSADPSANVYDLAIVEGVGDTPPPLPPTAAHFAPFILDAYGYPPPFLLIPRALLWVTRSFFSQRLLFGAASLALMLYACAAAAATLEGAAGRRAWLLAPIILASPSVLATLQVGNFHLAAVALCLLCWVALERRADGPAGALLAAATLAKIFPGLLGVLLLVQRRWRAAAFTGAAAALLCALSVIVLGTKVWTDFMFYHLPHVQSGEALRFLDRSPREVAFNLAPFGLAFKLRELGFAGWGWPQARLVGSVYTGLLFVLAVLAGRNQGSPAHRLTVWLAVVMLASLRSPYAAPFVLSTLVVLLVVLAAEVRSRRDLAGYLAFWALITVPTPGHDPTTLIAVSLARTLALYALLAWAALRSERVMARAP